MKVDTTAEADALIEAIDAWWRAHRREAPTLFLDEIDEARTLLEGEPRAGPVFRSLRGALVRRVLLRRSSYHVYYVVREAEGIVLVVSVWSAVRGSTPSL